MSALAPAFVQETRRLRVAARRMWRSKRQVKGKATDNLARLIEIHRERRPRDEVNRLPILSFAVESTRTEQGTRFVLWWPVVEVLRLWRESEAESWIEEWICEDEVALAYVPNDVEVFLKKIIPFIEHVRVGKNPYLGQQSSLRLTIAGLQDAAAELVSDADQKLVAHLHEAMTRHGRGEASKGQDQAELRVIADTAPEWAVRACVEFLRFAQRRAADDSPMSLALASESSLAADWLRPEEDAAWSNL
jgi:hypothetical protein